MNLKSQGSPSTVARIILSYTMVFIAASLGGCSVFTEHDASQSSELQALLTESLDTPTILKTVANSTVVIIVNNTTARSTLIKNGVVIDQWNSAVADITGIWHKIGGQPKSKDTPPGIYSVDDLEHCPVWYPSQIIDYIEVGEATNGNGVGQREAPKVTVEQIVTPRDKRYWQIINQRSDRYGPCGRNNPLGHQILWFKGPYGFHGTTASSEYILSLPTEERRVSGGCIRNPRHKIKELFDSLVTLFQLEDYRRSVALNQKKIYQEGASPVTVRAHVGKNKNFKVRVIVGSFKKDLPFDDTSSHNNTVRLDGNVTCKIPIDSVPIYDEKVFRNVIGHYKKDEEVTIYNYHEGGRTPLKTDRGWILRYYGSNCEAASYRWKRHSLPTLPGTSLRQRMAMF